MAEHKEVKDYSQFINQSPKSWISVFDFLQVKATWLWGNISLPWDPPLKYLLKLTDWGEFLVSSSMDHYDKGLNLICHKDRGCLTLFSPVVEIKALVSRWNQISRNVSSKFCHSFTQIVPWSQSLCPLSRLMAALLLCVQINPTRDERDAGIFSSDNG